MDRMWQWAWDRHRPRYFWTLYAVGLLMTLAIYLMWSLLIVAIEGSGQYAEAAVVAVVAAPVLQYVVILPGIGRSRFLERWARGHEVNRAQALDVTYAWARRAIIRIVATHGVGAALLSVVVGVIASAAASQVAQYGILGALAGAAMGRLVHTVSRKEQCGLSGSPWPVTRRLATRCPVRIRAWPDGRAFRCSASRSCSLSWAGCWRPRSIEPMRTPFCSRPSGVH